MNIDTFLQVKKLSLEEEKIYSDYFGKKIILQREEVDRVFDVLYDFFHKQSASNCYEYQTNYYSWYARLAFAKLQHLPRGVVLNEVIHKLIPTAYLSGIHVLDELLWYLNLQTVGINEMKLVYQQIRNNIKSSDAIIGYDKNGEFRVLADAIKDVGLLSRDGNTNSINIAEYYTKLRETFFSSFNKIKKDLPYNSEDINELFISFLRFINQVDEEHIWYIVDSFANPDKYEILEEIKANYQVSSPPNNTEEAPDQGQAFLDGLLQNIGNFASWSETDSMRKSLLTWMEIQGDVGVARMTLAKQLQPLLPNIHEDIDTAGAIIELDRFLSDNGYPGKNEFLYFDDIDAGFHWHESYQ